MAPLVGPCADVSLVPLEARNLLLPELSGSTLADVNSSWLGVASDNESVLLEHLRLNQHYFYWMSHSAHLIL